MKTLKNHELCLYTKHYEGRPPSLPILKTECPICVNNINGNKTKKKKPLTSEMTPLAILARRRVQKIYRNSILGYAARKRYQDGLSYAKDLLMMHGWKGVKRSEIPKEVAELKLMMLKLKRASKQYKESKK